MMWDATRATFVLVMGRLFWCVIVPCGIVAGVVIAVVVIR